jgi:hypothetical protein
MKYRRAFLFVFLVALTAIILVGIQTREPTYEGKKLSLWLRELDSNSAEPREKKEQRHQRITEAINHMGVHALPLLKRRLSGGTTVWEKIGWKVNQSRSPIKIPFRSGYVTRGEGLFGFLALGTNAIPAFPFLMDQLEQGQEAETRAYAATILENLGTNAIPAAPVLAGATQDRDYLVRKLAIRAVTIVHPDPKELLSVLMVPLHDQTPEVRHYACDSIWQVLKAHPELGGQVTSLKQELMDSMNDSYPHVRRKAWHALKCIGVEVPEPE